jgi:hypothetical protein
MFLVNSFRAETTLSFIYPHISTPVVPPKLNTKGGAHIDIKI